MLLVNTDTTKQKKLVGHKDLPGLGLIQTYAAFGFNLPETSIAARYSNAESINTTLNP